ncbi:MAG: hypothetical protein N2312_06185 [Dictyoglomaceae bacterium]|nr:hypothetical protein [Dictyoglomaceae bacterium]
MKESPLENLRKKLEDIRKIIGDIIVPNSIKLQEKCEKFIILRQEIQDLIEELNKLKVPIEPELVRIKEIDSLVKSNLKVFDKGLKNSLLISKASSYPKEYWWWHILEIVALERRRKLRKILIYTSLLGAILIGIILFFTFYKTPEEEFLNALSSVDKLIEEKNYEKAEIEVKKLTEKYPNRMEIWLKLGIIQEKRGFSYYISAFNRAKNLCKSEDEFYMNRAMEYFRIREFKKAEKDINEILRKNKENPQALYILGSIFEEEGKLFDALNVFKKIESLGDKVEPQLMAMTKVRIGLLMQKIPSTIPLK